MTGKHTNGPWEVSKKTHMPTHHITTAGGSFLVAGVSMLRDADMQAANARLIASAPDLLSALKECEAWMSAVFEVHGGSSGDAAKIERARSAIAKAEGEREQ